MFSLGIISAFRAQKSLVHLTDRQLPGWIWPNNPDNYYGYRFTLMRNGSISLGVNLTADVPNEWYGTGTGVGTTNIGDSYQSRFTQQAGAPLTLGVMGTWSTITNTTRFGWEKTGTSYPDGGRVLVEIRDIATQTLQASARIWTPGYAP